MPYPANYRYTREHEWISVEGNIGSIGITDYAQNSLGDIVYVDAPKVGDTVTANATFGSVESVKAVSDLYSPVSGKVTAVNEALKTEPDKINQDAHGTWIIKVELSDPGRGGRTCSTPRRMRRLLRKKRSSRELLAPSLVSSRPELASNLAECFPSCLRLLSVLSAFG